jgi:tRNA 2-selenouridine synthase
VRGLLPIEAYLQNRDRYFLADVRSPGEYEEAHIPGAVNVPLFMDEERVLVGTTYWKEGTDRAKLVGLSLVAPRLPEMVADILAAANGREIVLYCWRGGMRSRSIFAVMEAMGYPARQLVGGYKAFRRQVVRFLSTAEIRQPLFVLNGLTGVGKTTVLKELEKLGAPVLDLEGMANHRGSAFGAVGLGRARSQKDFEALLFLALDQWRDAPFLLVEGEGKKIGPLVLPDFLYTAMSRGQHILLEAGLEVRVQRILDEYRALGDNREALAAAALQLQKKLGSEKCKALADQIRQGEIADAARILCTDYYDRYYRDSRRDNNYLAVVHVDNLAEGVQQILSIASGYRGDEHVHDSV